MVIKPFNYHQDFEHINFREHPECYQVGRGEQGVLMVEPYKSEILPYWHFRTPKIARQSADKIMQLFAEYRAANDFVGMDMARKFIQMGYTRARRYTNHQGGQKYTPDGTLLPRAALNGEKAAAAAIFKEAWDKLRADNVYKALKRAHQSQYG